MPAARARSRRRCVAPVRRDGGDRQAVVDQRLQVRAVPGDEDADHAIRPITSSPGSGAATTAHQPIPRLNTRRSSASSTWRASQREHRRPRPRIPVELRDEPVGDDTREVAGDAAAGDVRERLRASAQRARDVQVEPGRREQVVAFVVLLLEHAPREREAVRVHAGRGEPDHRVAALDPRAVDHLLARDDTDARAGEIELVVAVDPRAARPSRRRRVRHPPRGRRPPRPRPAPRPARARSPLPRRSRAAAAARPHRRRRR